MRYYDNTHSRLVAWAKILLPLAALALLSVLFLFSGKGDPSDPLPYAQADLDELARETRLGAPEFSGLTSDGSALTVTASEAREAAGGTPQAVNLNATLNAPSGFVATLSSATGQLDTASGEVALDGEVLITTSTGYTLTTNTMRGGLETGTLSAPEAVSGKAPFGTLTAGAMALTPDGTAHVLRFTNGVKLIYDPAK
ncbi:LPS export ABC transporter periplasmic protein LptC [Albirhodobacter sp. R86504]|jgi:lipopolysaccharide export system protein LptC|uniref:LPS export ABC transporter periplasmic protein LptC n=1 Tax=Albirhodobacter sp. R86504 TaxID=3093848 RepID=UPI00366FCF6D